MCVVPGERNPSRATQPVKGNRLEGRVGKERGRPGRPCPVPAQKGRGCGLSVLVVLGPRRAAGAQEVFIEQIKK